MSLLAEAVAGGATGKLWLQRKMAGSLRWSSPSLALSLVLAKPCEIQLLVVCVRGHRSGLRWKPKTTSCWYFSSSFSFFRTCHHWRPSFPLKQHCLFRWLACWAIYIHSATEDFSSEVLCSRTGWGAGGEQRAKEASPRLHSDCRLLGSPGPWFGCLLWGMLVRPRGCQKVCSLGGSALERWQCQPQQPEDAVTRASLLAP